MKLKTGKRKTNLSRITIRKAVETVEKSNNSNKPQDCKEGDPSTKKVDQIQEGSKTQINL